MKTLKSNLLIYLSIPFMIMGCQPANTPTDQENGPTDSLDGKTQLVVEQDVTEVNPEKVYTYKFLQDPADPMADVPSVEKPAVSPADVVEKTLGEQSKRNKGQSRPPLFSRDCLTQDSAELCSQQYLASYVNNYIEKNTFDAQTPSPLMYVSFILEADGSIQESSIRIDKKNSICEDCVKLAKKMVKDMPEWVPGMRNGELERSTIKFPIHFKKS